MAQCDGKIFKIPSGVFKLADSDITQKASNITYQFSNITRMSWPDGKPIYHRAGEDAID
jgi:hypothetical protein